MKATNKLAAAYLIWIDSHADNDEPIGLWLKSYNAEGHDGRGDVTFTDDKAAALRFESKEQAFECWRRIPKNRKRRPDGKPNRPLTHFTIQLLPETDPQPIPVR